MFPTGFLFGLGFDTVSEIGLLVIAGGAVAANLPWWAVLTLPILFAAGMSLLDTLDGAFMNVAYGWAFARPVRKIYYNITVTALSVAVALIIGGIEIVGLLADKAGIHRGPLAAIANVDLAYVGYGIVLLFVVTWAALGHDLEGRPDRRALERPPLPLRQLTAGRLRAGGGPRPSGSARGARRAGACAARSTCGSRRS